ncbi:uncharacterized protein LOC132197898 [Neocloeon triangulifer]|uniref:uncharacterized protein LOC132197898 n=1 Tax=Neocloeon triangulifer TaxID=2078957 RepID=UPI00286EC819|nr:uncharacterized protein LOC132197898 [Neocloeon triangulifer]
MNQQIVTEEPAKREAEKNCSEKVAQLELQVSNLTQLGGLLLAEFKQAYENVQAEVQSLRMQLDNARVHQLYKLIVFDEERQKIIKMCNASRSANLVMLTNGKKYFFSQSTGPWERANETCAAIPPSGTGLTST